MVKYLQIYCCNLLVIGKFAESKTTSKSENFLDYNGTKIRIITKRKIPPTVISEAEVCLILKAVDNLKHKAILFMIYSSGLGVGEVVRLKLEDIDSQRMIVHVRQSKGKKDRVTLLASLSLDILRDYIKIYKPEEWLFLGQDGKSHITERTVQRVFENACKKAGIAKSVTVHTLRHCFATHLL